MGISRFCCKGFVLMFGVFALTMWAAPIAASDEDIYVRPGPDGEIQISTPWEDYAAYYEGGGVYWVGTQREFDRRRVVGIELQNGERVSTVNASGADATFVPSASFRTRIGDDVPVDDVETAILFRADRRNPPRPKIPASSRYVVVSWIQNYNQTPLVLLFNKKTKKAIRPYFTGSDGQGQYSSEYSVPRAQLTSPFALIYVLPHRRPGVVYAGSLTVAAYLQDKESIHEAQADGISPDNATLQNISDLEQIDLSLQNVHGRTSRSRSTHSADQCFFGERTDNTGKVLYLHTPPPWCPH